MREAKVCRGIMCRRICGSTSRGLRGARDAHEERDMVAERMTKAQIIEAHRLTREWGRAKP